MKRLILIGALILSATANAKGKSKNLSADMDALGGNQDLIERASAIDPKNTTRVVQKREVELDNRFEIGINDGIVAGGDPYTNTNNLGGQVDFHFNPHWSVGARYYQSANSLSSEGRRVLDQADTIRQTNPSYPRPDIDYAKDTWLGTVSWYPFYGKLSLADLAVTQFDVYFVGGAGQVNLDYGSATTYTGGLGVAFWLSEHFSTRLEARYQGYNDRLSDGSSRQMDLTVLTIGIGLLL
jgi:outer membrane beta-barrel protein